MSKSVIQFHEDSWSTVANATVATTPRMGGKKVTRAYSVCLVPSKKFVATWIALLSNKDANTIEEVDGKYHLTGAGVVTLLEDLLVDFSESNLVANFNRFITKHIGRFNSKYGTSNDNIIDFAMGLVVLLNNNKDQLTRVGTVPIPQVKATKGSIDLSVL